MGRMRALEAQSARVEAAKRELLASRFDRLSTEPGEFDTNLRETASNLAVELRLSDRTIERRMIAASRIPLRWLSNRQAAHSVEGEKLNSR